MKSRRERDILAAFCMRRVLKCLLVLKIVQELDNRQDDNDQTVENHDPIEYEKDHIEYDFHRRDLLPLYGMFKV